MTNHVIGERENANLYLANNPEVNIGDTIEIETDNQEGYKKYKVISGENGKKDLKTIADWSMDIYEGEGGKKKRKSKSKRRRRRKSRKGRKSRKSKRY